MVCPRCGKRIVDPGSGCPSCGRGVVAGTLTPPPATSAITFDADISDDATVVGGFDAPTVFTAPPGSATSLGAEAPATYCSPEAATTFGSAGDATGFPGMDTAGQTGAGGSLTDAGFGGSDGDHGPLNVGQVFGTRYHIIRLLGVGGMGAVYQAWDQELSVAVAIKVIRPEVMADPTAAADIERRFKRELLLARQVTHKNVVRIHDLGEIDGIKYITMAYVNGADLASLIRKHGQVAPARTLHIARSVVSGLVAAHGAGVVHRDLKPANIMVGADDEALIMDFGIARSTGDGVGPAASGTARSKGRRGSLPKYTDATAIGAIVGTVEYMAPEQAKGQDVDQRADVYAFGLILYDMLAGRRRAEGAGSAFGELQARMEHAPAPIKSIVPEVSEALDGIVSRCIEPDREKRFQSTAEIAAELDRLDENGEPIPIKRVVGMKVLAAVVTLAFALVGGGWWYASKWMAPVQHAPLSVLIADFQNSTGDPAFDGTLEQALGTSLEGASFITNYRRDDARRVVVQELKASDRLDERGALIVSRREGVKVILVGSIQSKGSGYAVAVRAIDPANGQALGTASGSAAKKDDVLKAVAAVASRLRSVLGDTTPESEKRAAAETVTATSLEALQAYERGQSLSLANKLDEALAAYQQAIAIDPGLGRAYSGMAVVYYFLKDEVRMKTAYEEALKRVDRMTPREKYRTLGTYYLTVVRNYEQAIENYETLLKLYPADNVGHGNLGYAYMKMGNPERAAAEAREVLKIYPENFRERGNLAYYLMMAGNHKDAIAESTRVIEAAPANADAYLPVALSMLASGDVSGALNAYDRMESTGDTGARLARLGRIDLAMYRGRYREAQKIVAAAQAADAKSDSTQLALESLAAAQAAVALGQKKPAAEAALKATTLSTHESVLFPAALVLIEARRPDAARKVAVTLDNMLQAQTTAYARLITAQIAAADDRYGEALAGFKDSVKERDTWFAHFQRGMLYVETKHFPEALGDLEEAAKHGAKVSDLFVWNIPTLRYVPPLYYWLARSKQAVGDIAGARKNYEQYISIRTEADPPDPLVADSRTRLGQLE